MNASKSATDLHFRNTAHATCDNFLKQQTEHLFGVSVEHLTHKIAFFFSSFTKIHYYTAHAQYRFVIHRHGRGSLK